MGSRDRRRTFQCVFRHRMICAKRSVKSSMSLTAAFPEAKNKLAELQRTYSYWCFCTSSPSLPPPSPSPPILFSLLHVLINAVQVETLESGTKDDALAATVMSELDKVVDNINQFTGMVALENPTRREMWRK
jgi:hypothetical protein